MHPLLKVMLVTIFFIVNFCKYNTNGSHNCSCKEGYTGDGRSCSGTWNSLLKLMFVTKFFVVNFFTYTLFAFVDIDECNNGNHVCDVNARCTNTNGSYNCTCKEGFIGDGRSCSGILNTVLLSDIWMLLRVQM